MKIFISNFNSKYLETISAEKLDNIEETFKKFSLIKEPMEAKIFAINDLLTAHQLSKLKNIFDKINIRLLLIYSNNRKTILAGKSLKSRF